MIKSGRMVLYGCQWWYCNSGQWKLTPFLNMRPKLYSFYSWKRYVTSHDLNIPSCSTMLLVWYIGIPFRNYWKGYCKHIWARLTQMSNQKYPKQSYNMLRHIVNVGRLQVPHVRQLLFDTGFVYAWIAKGVGMESGHNCLNQTLQNPT